ncbi:MAG: T9SS type A sorting domain-containing protein [Bacteroidia bacterium]|nr:T9SS type A sorting domain-containing protein [Bacteroidia bacterium]
MRLKLLIPLCCFCFLSLWGNAQTYISVGVTQAPALVANAGFDQTICPWMTADLGGSPTASGGSPTYTYAWTGDSINDPSLAGPTVHPTVSGNYIVTVTDAKNCTASDTVMVTVDTCVGLPDPKLPIEFTIFPNPNSGNFRAVAAGEFPTGDLTLKITNLQGQVIEERTVKAVQGRMEEEFALPLLSGGIYQVHFLVGEHQFVRKMSVQK